MDRGLGGEVNKPLLPTIGEELPTQRRVPGTVCAGDLKMDFERIGARLNQPESLIRNKEGQMS